LVPALRLDLPAFQYHRIYCNLRRPRSAIALEDELLESVRSQRGKLENVAGDFVERLWLSSFERRPKFSVFLKDDHDVIVGTVFAD
jgi:hypothetical protein